jgi:2-polyprenyl-3-methyl-5-hydroxy-6-metoxy-1,4-benzoquinol methylase
MPTRPINEAARGERERRAYDEDGVFERSTAWMQRVIHVFEGPNTRRGEALFSAAAGEAARGARVLDVGCGRGTSTFGLLVHKPSYVLGIDVSSREIELARHAATGMDSVEFRLQSAHQPIADRFDLIIGRSVLHHIDFREFLRRAFDDNLRPGGRMIFMEPMSHPLAVAFHRLVRSAHTPDERPLGRADVAWLRRQFPAVVVYGINLLSFPAGIVSTFSCRSADNRLMRAADEADRRMLGAVPWLAAHARQGIIVIDKPPAA